jgi:hypothetical protein
MNPSRLAGHSRLADGRAHIEHGFNFSAFCEVLSAVVAARDITWRALALETDVTTATLKRMAHGKCPDASSLAVLSAWADLNLADFVLIPPNWTKPDTAAKIATVLNSDPALEESAARDLDAIVHLAYDRIKQQHALTRSLTVDAA